MAAQPTTFRIHPESELADALRKATHGEALYIEAQVEIFALAVRAIGSVSESEPRESPSPGQVERSIAGLRKAAGGWRDLVDADALLEYTYAGRRTGNRPPVSL
jgi:hypothetical protein